MNDYLPMLFELIALLLVSIALWRFHKRTRYFHDLATCEELLEISTLAKRAAPNERLKIAFGIENFFTTTDNEYHQQSRDSIQKKLEVRDTAANRILLREEASGIIRHGLEGNEIVDLEKLVRNVVFRTVLSILFPEVPQPSTTDVEFLTLTIDSLWYDSKAPLEILVARFLPNHSCIVHKRNALHSKLKQIFSQDSSEGNIPPHSNPLNTLLPAYIGLWKVVLKAFIEVRFRSSPVEQTEYTSLILKFIQSPTNEIWYQRNDFGISAQSIIAETLRLYPPTRRIYIKGEDGITRAVDIEALHRRGEVWGKDPDRFNPHRWTILDVVKTKWYMPFGAKGSSISKCPSRTRGGPKLCAVLLGALLQEIDQEWELVDESKVLDSTVLKSGRDTFKNLTLMRTSLRYSD